MLDELAGSANSSKPTPTTEGTIGNRLWRHPVAEIMSRHLLAVDRSDTVFQAWEVMRRHNVRYLPVLDGRGWCLGVIGATEVAATCALGLVLDPPTAEAILGSRRNPHVPDTATIAQAARAMTENGLDALPVVDVHGRLRGLVTARDLVAVLGRLDTLPEGVPDAEAHIGA